MITVMKLRFSIELRSRYLDHHSCTSALFLGKPWAVGHYDNFLYRLGSILENTMLITSTFLLFKGESGWGKKDCMRTRISKNNYLLMNLQVFSSKDTYWPRPYQISLRFLLRLYPFHSVLEVSQGLFLNSQVSICLRCFVLENNKTTNRQIN